MDPRPRLTILRRRHLLHFGQVLQPWQIGFIGKRAGVAQALDVSRVDALPVGRQLEVLGQPLVQPQRHVADDAVQQGVRQLVAQVLLDAVAPERVDLQVVGAADGPRLGDEEGAPLRQIRVARLHEALVTFAILEQVHLHGCVAGRKLQLLADLVAHSGQLLKERLVARHLEVREEHVRRNAERILRRRRGSGRGRVVPVGLGSVGGVHLERMATDQQRKDGGRQGDLGKTGLAAIEGVVCTLAHEHLDSPATRRSSRPAGGRAEHTPARPI